ncbi:MAG TPA: prepilin-type N-terminal cleavage/methylation domain-containing protein [Gemmatimonadaceae bacterium]|nr:prepilin-type N-terminal cleavage/methylation domain-containing protein [Gemmatimonadaceae bacterium]
MMKNRKGFTLIELLIVVVIIGILAAIAIPKFANTKEKAYIAAMKSDLRNLVTAEEAFFADNMTYTNVAASNVGGTVTADPATGFTPSAGVTVAATADAGLGWSGTAGHTGTTITCNIGVGSQVPAGSAEGEPKCAAAAVTP